MKLNSSKSPRNLGFALVATLLLLILLSLLAVGLLSLSSVALRSSFQGSAQAEARANARLALMIAIGELQKQMGADQRVSASGAIISDSSVMHPHWTGVWDSWQAGGMASGADTKSEHSTIAGASNSGMAPSYQAQRKDHFRAWLLSLNPGEASQVDLPSSLALDGMAMPGGTAEAVRLVGVGSLGAGSGTEDYVSARLLPVKSTSSGSGRYAWWAGDESQKARIMDDPYEAITALTSAEKIFRSQSPGSTGTKTVKGLEAMTSDGQLAGLPTLATLDLVSGATGRPAQRNFHSVTPYSSGVLADVREGGLKRDLSTLLEQPINLGDTGDQYMLYRFAATGEEQVPIQDLSAYYQLYHDDPAWANGRRGGVKYTSSALGNTIQAQVPDYGNNTTKEKYLRQYTALYTNPVPIKIQFLLALGATPITAADKADIAGKGKLIRPTDTHKLLLGVMPVVTLWNPNNVPLVMNSGANSAQVLKMNCPPFAFQLRKYLSDGTIHNNGYFNLNNSIGGEGTGDGRATRLAPHLFKLRFGQSKAIVFEPGEVKIFSLPSNAGGKLTDDGGALNSTNPIYEPVNEWDPYGFFVMYHGSRESSGNGTTPGNAFKINGRSYMFFGSGDSITTEIGTESTADAGRQVAKMNETYGGGFNFYLLDNNYEPYSPGSHANQLRNYQFMSRFGGGTGLGAPGNEVFNAALMTPGFPGGVAPIPYQGQTNAIPGSQLIGASSAGEVVGFMEFSMAAGCETGSASVGGFGGGRRIATRPFLHGSIIAAPFLDQADKASLYNYGWDWQLGRILNIEDSIIQGDPGTGKAFYGGGYTVEAGTTEVVQQEIPVVPPISIAALSHAHLGGFSLANAPVVGTGSAALHWKSSEIRDATEPDAFQRVTATGQGGLGPHVLQAIGNSYAHPNIPADKAFKVWNRFFDSDTGPKDVAFADHSYLANKALWDEFFFSSITPQPVAVKLFESSDRDTKQVAQDFFLSGKPLPNRRIEPYIAGLDQTKLDQLFAQKDVFAGGLGDKIAAHLLVKGSFNVNSTSVDAWKVLFSSLKGKPVAYFQTGVQPSEATPEGTTFGPGALPSGIPVKSADITKPNVPAGQWKSGREITDQEIDALAEAMVKQVKLRGPFLSLSEFVNRRLDGSDTELALKGALQAAIDDGTVSINAPFRESRRKLDDETVGITFVFPEAAKGPIAYGSAPYLDQADVLRNFAAQLTPRGDTFVIRTYGDALDPAGNVLARAWCEAVVQRVPDYVDGADENHIKTALLKSDANKQFGRKFEIVSFRWLNPGEV
jgi:type II secretory pathway pseudopilin PulG